MFINREQSAIIAEDLLEWKLQMEDSFPFDWNWVDTQENVVATSWDWDLSNPSCIFKFVEALVRGNYFFTVNSDSNGVFYCEIYTSSLGRIAYTSSAYLDSAIKMAAAELAEYLKRERHRRLLPENR